MEASEWAKQADGSYEIAEDSGDRDRLCHTTTLQVG